MTLSPADEIAGICNGPGSGQVLAEIILDGRATSADISSLAP